MGNLFQNINILFQSQKTNLEEEEEEEEEVKSLFAINFLPFNLKNKDKNVDIKNSNTLTFWEHLDDYSYFAHELFLAFILEKVTLQIATIKQISMLKTRVALCNVPI